MQAGIGNVYEKKRYYIKIKINIDIIIYDIMHMRQRDIVGAEYTPRRWWMGMYVRSSGKLFTRFLSFLLDSAREIWAGVAVEKIEKVDKIAQMGMWRG